jgi:hypothetical protein
MFVGRLSQYDGVSNWPDVSLPEMSVIYDLSTLEEYDTVWRTIVVPANVALPTAKFVAMSGNWGSQNSGVAKGAVYIQEFNSWCAFGVHNSAQGGYSQPESGTGYFIGVPGVASAFTPPPEMEGAWRPVY